MLAIVLIVGVDSEHPSVRGELRALITKLRELAEFLPRRVVPDKARGSIGGRLEDQLAILRNGKSGLPEIEKLVHFLLCQRQRRSRGLKAGGIEGLSHNRAVAYIEQIAGSEQNVASGSRGDELGRARIDRRDIDSGTPPGVAGPIHAIEKVFSIGEEKRPMMSFTATRFNRCDRPRSTTNGAHLVEGPSDAGSEHNHTILIPSTAEESWGIAYVLHGRIGKIDSLQPALRKEPDMEAIRRPERKDRALGARDLLRIVGGKSSDPERSFAVRSQGNKGQAVAVGRDGEAIGQEG